MPVIKMYMYVSIYVCMYVRVFICMLVCIHSRFIDRFFFLFSFSLCALEPLV